METHLHSPQPDDNTAREREAETATANPAYEPALRSPKVTHSAAVLRYPGQCSRRAQQRSRMLI